MGKYRDFDAVPGWNEYLTKHESHTNIFAQRLGKIDTSDRKEQFRQDNQQPPPEAAYYQPKKRGKK